MTQKKEKLNINELSIHLKKLAKENKINSKKIQEKKRRFLLKEKLIFNVFFTYDVGCAANNGYSCIVSISSDASHKIRANFVLRISDN